MNNIGVVVIGRNEGERLKICIRSLMACTGLRIIYVDSGSTDGSEAFVKAQGFDTLALDMSTPFSAARARNEGYQFLINQYQDIDYVQFVDGDCEVCEGWIQLAYEHLQQHSEVASVCGRRKERFPEKTVYNQLCDIEWNTPVGRALSTGGDFMCRKQALLDVDGFSAQVIAGEEPEMCFRMRQQGWKIDRIDANMTWHDADMTRLSQVWKRYERSGHAYAQGFFMHGNSPEKYYRNDVLRIVLWGFCIPTLAFLVACVVGLWGLLVLLIYPLKIGQIFMRKNTWGSSRVACVYACSLVLGKFPQLIGAMTFWFKCFFGKQLQIIEYKH